MNLMKLFSNLPITLMKFYFMFKAFQEKTVKAYCYFIMSSIGA